MSTPTKLAPGRSRSPPIAIFMVSLDNLVVTNALASIREDLGASIEALEWTVNAYTLAFAVFLLTGAALGDRFGRRRVFVIGLGIFTAASAAAALAPSTGALIAARAHPGRRRRDRRAAQPHAPERRDRAEKRGLALGIWSGVSGLGVALGPLVGGAVIEGISWQWIFWLNVPVGLVARPARRCAGWTRATARRSRLDLPGLALASPACSASSTASCAATRPAGARSRSSARSPPARSCSSRSSPGSCARPRRCCRCGSSARARSPPRTASRSR